MPGIFDSIVDGVSNAFSRPTPRRPIGKAMSDTAAYADRATYAPPIKKRRVNNNDDYGIGAMFDRATAPVPKPRRRPPIAPPRPIVQSRRPPIAPPRPIVQRPVAPPRPADDYGIGAMFDRATAPTPKPRRRPPIAPPRRTIVQQRPVAPPRPADDYGIGAMFDRATAPIPKPRRRPPIAPPRPIVQKRPVAPPRPADDYGIGAMFDRASAPTPKPRTRRPPIAPPRPVKRTMPITPVPLPRKIVPAYTDYDDDDNEAVEAPPRRPVAAPRRMGYRAVYDTPMARPVPQPRRSLQSASQQIGDYRLRMGSGLKGRRRRR